MRTHIPFKSLRFHGQTMISLPIYHAHSCLKGLSSATAMDSPLAIRLYA